MKEARELTKEATKGVLTNTGGMGLWNMLYNLVSGDKTRSGCGGPSWWIVFCS